MNVKERNSFLAQSLDALRFVGKGDKKDSILDIAKLEVEWHKMHKPPIENYINPYGLNELWEITNDLKLMNRPDKRVRYMDDLMKRFGICFLNAGTNRRIYYHTLDPYIVFKTGSDQVGRSDNISEFHMQNNIFPFCTRTYSTLPNGMIALSEMVEVMTERDYKTKWANEIFDLILAIASKGFVMEDVGGNFYKNLGIRIGFGPVFVDYPYVYRIDFRKTLCSYINPLTGEKCDGELDYDYKKGMSEIVCDKCGTRFSAKHLAFNAKEDRIERRKEKFTMSNNFKLSIVRGNDTVFRTYNESEAASIQNFSEVARVTRRPEPERPNEIIVTPRRTQAVEQQPRPQFKTSVQRGNNRQEFGRNNQEDNGYQRRSQNPPKEEIIPDIETFLYEMHQKHGKGTAIYLARRLGVYYQDPNEKKHTSDITATVRVSDTPEFISPKRGEKRTAKAVSSNKEDTLMQEIAKSGSEQEEPMIPMKPKTAAELAAMDKESRNENVVMGFPGEPLVDTMRIEQKVPLIVKAIENRFNNKVIRDGVISDADLMRQIEKDVKEFLEYSLEMNQLYKNGLDGLEVKVNSLLDHMNKVCFLVKVEMHKSSLLDVTLYPSEEKEDRHDYEDKEYENYLARAAMDSQEECLEEDEEVLKDEDIQEDDVDMDHSVSNIVEFFEDRIKQYSMDKDMVDIKELTPEEAINRLSRKLLCDAVDQKSYPYAMAHEAAKKFAAKYLGYGDKSIEDMSAASQL